MGIFFAEISAERDLTAFERVLKSGQNFLPSVCGCRRHIWIFFSCVYRDILDLGVVVGLAIRAAGANPASADARAGTRADGYSIAADA